MVTQHTWKQLKPRTVGQEMENKRLIRKGEPRVAGQHARHTKAASDRRTPAQQKPASPPVQSVEHLHHHQHRQSHGHRLRVVKDAAVNAGKQLVLNQTLRLVRLSPNVHTQPLQTVCWLAATYPGTPQTQHTTTSTVRSHRHPDKPVKVRLVHTPIDRNGSSSSRTQAKIHASCSKRRKFKHYCDSGSEGWAWRTERNAGGSGMRRQPAPRPQPPNMIERSQLKEKHLQRSTQSSSS